MTKIVFIYPEMYELARLGQKRKEFPPFGVMYLASVVEDLGINTSILKVTKERYLLDLTDYDIVAFSIPSSASYEIIKKSMASSLYRQRKFIIVGGVHPSLYPEETFIDLNPNVLIIGSGENVIIEILKNIPKNDFSQIKGICYQKNGNVIKTSPRPLENIDLLPIPARHLLPENDFIMENRLAKTSIRMTHIMLSRGCPFSCYFCAVLQKKVQYRNIKSIRNELQHLKSKYDINGFAIIDDNFIINKAIVKSFCDSIQDLQLKWSALSRVDTVDYEVLEAMHNAGCIEIKFGIESGSKEILSRMGKNVSIDQIRNAINLASSIGIMVKVFLIHGFPGENISTTKETIELLSEMKEKIDRVSLFRFVPLPGSYVFNNPKKFGLVLFDSKNWSRYHINNNDYHWWGDEDDFKEMCLAYNQIKQFISDNWAEV